ncbi:family 20 glycosylhydrolase [Streptomyces sp. P38-E01]|uniref:Family 20 glycosylhydrolase n=1 Tax=Streptomyces tardus TaxID=2780544 RepID=A0A949JB06_9ACTN|nr:family 20 glycosylhydrolase [Streptomyces tardus]MBU7596747.1 family 20 glycosylhydrolase [Streptomyces tardus]
MGSTRRKRAALGVIAVTVAGAAVVTATQLGCTDGGGSGGEGGATGGGETADQPQDAATHPPGVRPRVIPAVRDWEAARGPGWKLDRDTRIVAESGSAVEDEARRLARELRVDYADSGAGAGDVELALDSDLAGGREAYELTTADGRVRISGSSDAGVFYGTRTLVQSLRERDAVPEGTVRDRPDRPQRGLMVDTARKHFSAEWLADRLREMADLKLNQLQLHFSDDQGFRIESETSPGSVSEQHLTKKQVRELVRLARSLHITVVPEIDSPGHLGALLAEHPELALRNGSGELVEGAIDIGKSAAGRLVDELLEEYAELFPGTYWHLGGDEYRPLTAEDPEANHPRLHRIAQRRFGEEATVRDLATAWLNDRAKAVRKLGYTPQVWNDGMHAGGVVTPSKGREVTYWTGKEIGARPPGEYLAEGWKLINLNDEYLYYVLGEPQQFTYPTGERIYREWTPAVLRGSRAEPAGSTTPSRVPGARLAVWCDLADAQSVQEVAAGIRMPLRALAQKVWDPREPKESWQEFRELADEVDRGDG